MINRSSQRELAHLYLETRAKLEPTHVGCYFLDRLGTSRPHACGVPGHPPGETSPLLFDSLVDFRFTFHVLTSPSNVWFKKYENHQKFVRYRARHGSW